MNHAHDHATPSLIVEFAGLRGVGKSTLVPFVSRELRERGISVGVPRLHVTAKAAVVISSFGPRLTVRWRLRPWPPFSRAARRFDARLARYLLRLLRAQGRPGVHLVAGGIGQLMMTVHAQGARPDWLGQWDALCDVVPLPDLIVLLDADDRAIELRRTSRGTADDRRAPLPTAEERAALGALEAYLTSRRGAGRVDLACMTALGDPAELAHQVADYIARRVIA